MVSLIFDLGNTLKKDLSLETSKDISREIFRKFDVDENTIKIFNQMLLDSLRQKKKKILLLNPYFQDYLMMIKSVKKLLIRFHRN